ncbi:ATP-binding cassette domain-containing protein [Actinokineospora diospyrosa]|uniref:FHA modulated ABC efflux pump with fused ATPase and integral membrane subunits n=1 Tax=Actinokineospora diospyrosa TaxID=103728 RepID=A0ABT1I9L5_9PSEU|nr:ATP-binding cassette domain-containing protein [Actinokineospora diospyrosa]MCP2269319.1 FHA modulated ABC efflux pump with fused ATPase and integral membrane subunits [Actinokineospora diospyrosa]
MAPSDLDLVVTSGARRWAFAPGVVVRIGRAPTCDVVVDDPAVSREHLRAEYDGGWVVRDSSSAGGTSLRGARVSRFTVADEAVVRLADAVEVVLRVGGRAPGPGGEVRIGRAPDNDIVLVDPMVSRRHAAARRSGDDWLVTDLGGRNPTLLNGTAITGDTLARVGDTLTLGSSEIVVAEHGLSRVPRSAHHLVVDDVTLALPDGRNLLSGVSLDIAPGEFVAVVGPSGSGKSTLLKVMTGDLAPSTGQVTYDGTDVCGHGAVRTLIGTVPQDDVLHTSLSARAALSYTAALRLPADTGRAERRAAVDGALSQVDLLEHADTRVKDMSGGQRKRVSIAMELLTSPPLLVLDEPTSGLDPNLDRQIMSTLRSIADRGRSVVVVTHSTDNLAWCDRILILAAPGGVPIFLGPPAELRIRFGTADWAEIFEEASRHSAPEPVRAALARRPGGAGGSGPAPAVRSWRAQARTLVLRHAALIAADRAYAAFLLCMPLVLAVLALAVPGLGGFGPPDPDDPGEAGQLLVLLFVGAAFTGGACGIREIVAERAIFRRERAAGLPVLAYVVAKAVVFAVVCAVQATLLVGGTVLAKPAPESAVLLVSPALELAVAALLTGFTSCAAALFLSSLVRSAEQAMPVLVVVVMAQLVLCGGMIPVTGRPVLAEVSWLAPSRWGYAAGSSTVDLAGFPGAQDDPLWRHSAPWWLLSGGVLVALAAVFLLSLARRLARSGPGSR